MSVCVHSFIGEWNTPEVRFRVGRLLVSQKPSVCVGRVDDVEVTPDERTRRRSEWFRRGSAPGVLVGVVVSVLALGTCQRGRRERGQDRQQIEGGELHRRMLYTLCRRVCCIMHVRYSLGPPTGAKSVQVRHGAMHEYIYMPTERARWKVRRHGQTLQLLQDVWILFSRCQFKCQMFGTAV